jgi:hypothetical protein
MDLEKSAGATAIEVPSPPTDEGKVGPEPGLPEWPSEPQPLKHSKISQVLSTAFDVALCFAPLLLLVKAGLCLLASQLDSSKTGEIADPPSNLTLYLLRFNDQVS